MAGNPKPNTTTNMTPFSASMPPPLLSPLLLLLLLFLLAAVSVNAYAAHSPSPAPSHSPAPGLAPLGPYHGAFSYNFSPPSPPPPPEKPSLPPSSSRRERRSGLNYGEKVGLAFLGLALAVQLVLGGYLAFKRWQLGKLEHGGGGRRASVSSPLHSS